MLNSSPSYFVSGIITLLISFTIHEFAHAWTATRLGDDTPRLYGRLTLNPIAHLDILGSLMLIFAGFGWAKPVPVNPRRFNNYRRDDILVSLAGIACNLLLAFFAAIMLRTFYAIGQFPFRDQVVFILRSLMLINVILGTFNLIPIPPLDGSHVLYHYLPVQAASKFRMLERYGFIILLLFLMTGIFGIIITPPLKLFSLIAGPLGYFRF